MTNYTSLIPTLSDCIRSYKTKGEVYVLLRRQTGLSTKQLDKLLPKLGVEFPEQLAGE